MKTLLKLFAMAAAVAAITACSGEEHGHPHDEDGGHPTEEQHEHGEGTHEHDENQPETEAYYGDEKAEPASVTEETGKKEEDTHTHENGEEHGHH